ncbi:phosphoribosylglycinamide formyltransferase [Enterococcus cecorum]|uniref:Phosphoribosylglycinamide formyltransferase n=1 Tax=Enterococcus cecorum DSM 20682 = ATCC 43198 TaxID=1121864 RepID=S1QWE3_9ENTE|nr:phosphoribosylglycinamide formyltransferase [Enterococcus cecorum]HLQ88272.1 phosphoribosylglycinamide formyltransferase [Enterococcus sp.]EOX18056.1 phosphoribosylglycinamide formyltransferase [Enterococcus cecorum DSM 20682 = ATCC 43198]ESK62187.1 phosphoribosylglycinamide formyltransferase [Enterococcus cecorum DSM 20682 = ATCC 43198]KLN93817.1 phosphoribosylglycinamide formyltransferase [Enterococcus cecorum]KLN94751.1 phosphoribosylglycinamide formyltransferase [Enterococcus cecorum]
MRVAILASGNGSNFEALAHQFQAGLLPGELIFVFSDHHNAYVLERARRLNVCAFSFEVKEFANKAAYEKALLQLLQEQEIDLIVLAGYMRIIGQTLLSHYSNRILNIHPSLLPSFPGLHGIKDAYEYGVKVTGVTVHLVDDGVDTGPIIAQEPVMILPEDSLESLEEKIHQTEHRLYPKVLRDVLLQSDKNKSKGE